MDESTTNAEPTAGAPGETAGGPGEPAAGTEQDSDAAGWAAQLQRMIDDIGRQAVPVIREVAAKAGDRALGAACASDAFFPFADAVETCLAAGVTAFVQPGGSQRDAETLAVVEAAGAAMLLTGRRHFRH